MIAVFHHQNKDPEIFFDINEHTEKRLIHRMEQSGMAVKRCSDEEWPGQSNKKYAVHHWNVTKKR